MFLKEFKDSYLIKGHQSSLITFYSGRVTSYSYNFTGTIDADRLSPGEYELVADGWYECRYYLDTPLSRYRGDKIETAIFRILPDKWKYSGSEAPDWETERFDDSGWEERSPPFGNGYFRKTFEWDGKQTSLLLDAKNDARCYVNGRGVFELRGVDKYTQTLLDITGYLKPGRNVVACSATGITRVCTAPGGCWRQCGDACGCTWDRGIPQGCADETVSWCTDEFAIGHRCFKRLYSYLYPKIVFHDSRDILWSNDNSNWYYGPLEITDDTPWFEKPNHFNFDWEKTTYLGVKPFRNRFTHFNKWFFVNTTNQILYISSVTEPDCTINGEQVFLEPQDADWWVFAADVSAQARPGANQVLCTVERNDFFNLFDIKLEEFEEEIILPPPPPPPPPPGNYSSPFKPSKGDSQESGSDISPLAGMAAWAGGTGFGPGSGSGASPVSTQTVSIILSALGAVGAARYLTRRRPSPKTLPLPPGFWQGFKSKLAPIRHPGRALGGPGGRGGPAIAPARTTREAPPRMVSLPYKAALGGINGLTGRFGVFGRLGGRITSKFSRTSPGNPWTGGAAPALGAAGANPTNMPRHGSSRFWQRISNKAAGYKSKIHSIKNSDKSFKKWNKTAIELYEAREQREEMNQIMKFVSALEGSEWHRMQKIDKFIAGSGMSASSVAYLTSIKKGYEAIRNQKLRLQELNRQRILAERGAGHKPNYTDAQLQEMASRGGELGFWARKELEARQNRSTQDSAPDAGEVFEFGEGSGENATGGQGTDSSAGGEWWRDNYYVEGAKHLIDVASDVAEFFSWSPGAIGFSTTIKMLSADTTEERKEVFEDLAEEYGRNAFKKAASFAWETVYGSFVAIVSGMRYALSNPATIITIGEGIAITGAAVLLYSANSALTIGASLGLAITGYTPPQNIYPPGSYYDQNTYVNMNPLFTRQLEQT